MAVGEFRLRDLAEPELLYQLTHPDLPAGFPPIRTLAERTTNLPVPVSSFIGRESELAQTTAALHEARVVTLTGPGGVGKTRLAVQAAGQVLPRFGDGARLCEPARTRPATRRRPRLPGRLRRPRPPGPPRRLTSTNPAPDPPVPQLTQY
jgi:hypothetical protein